MKKYWYTIKVFAQLNTRRFFRDRLAIFFGILFPLIFLFVFGGIFGGRSGNISFNVGLVNNSSSTYAQQFVHNVESSKVFKVDKSVTSLANAQDKMKRNQIDATIVLPPDFGTLTGNGVPGGQAKVYYTINNEQAGQTLVTILQQEFSPINAKFVTVQEPFKAVGVETKNKSLTQFDYTFAGLLGFSVLGIGIFGPINVFPELKKQGILRRFHTTPLSVAQYFTSTAISQTIVGLVSLAIFFAVAIGVFHLKVVGNYWEIIAFLILSIVTILGIGLAIGGWARNERQAAPLGNIVVFPMMFLSGVFFPRFLMPDWLQGVSNYIPLSAVVDGVRLLTTEGKHLAGILPQIGVLSVWLVVIYVVAFRVFRWE